MPIKNSDVAEIFNKVADLLELEGANPFRIRAYRSTARLFSDLPQSVADMVKREEDLSELPGIGKDLAGKIKGIVETGALDQLKELEGRIPKELENLLKLEGLGPKRVVALHKNLGIETPKELREAPRRERFGRSMGLVKRRSK